MFGLSLWELMMIAVVALVVLGPKRLPGMMQTIARGLRSFQKVTTELRSAIDEPLREVRRPLDEVRHDLYATARQLERRLIAETQEQALEAPDAPVAPDLPVAPAALAAAGLRTVPEPTPVTATQPPPADASVPPSAKEEEDATCSTTRS